MATITKISGVIENKTLPIITPNGFVTNHYFGSFANALAAGNVEITQDDKTVIEQFINKGIQEDWIKYVKYYAIFYGTSEHKETALVPLIDNVDNYQMTEENDNLNDNIFNIDDGKVIGIGGDNSNTIGTYIPTPISGNCSIIVSFKTPSTLSTMRQYFVSKRDSLYINAIRVMNGNKIYLYYIDYSGGEQTGSSYNLEADSNYLMLYGISNTSSTPSRTNGVRRRVIYKNGENTNVLYKVSGIPGITSRNENQNYKYDIITRASNYNTLENLIYSVGFVDVDISEETANKIFNAIIELEVGLGKYTLPSNE